MKVFIDTNVLLDFYCQREDFYQNAADIFDLACKGVIEIWVSPISFVNFFYITRNVKDFASVAIPVLTPSQFLLNQQTKE